MEDKIDAYRQRQKDRRKLQIILILFWAGFLVVGSLVSHYIPITSNIFFWTGYFGFIIMIVAYGKTYAFEKYEIRISVDFLDALSLIKMSTKEKGRVANRHRKMAMKHVNRAMVNVSKLFRLAEHSEIMEKEMCDRLDSFAENVQKFVMPRVVLGTELERVESTLDESSKFFGDQWESTGLKQLDDINQNIQNLGKPPKELTTFLVSLRGLFRSKPIVLILSLGAGFGLTSLIIFGFLTTDSMQWIRSNIGSFIVAGTAMSAFIATVIIRGT